jgi:hypothetical protein
MANKEKTKLAVKTEVKRHHLSSDELEFGLPDDPVLVDGWSFCFSILGKFLISN